MDEFIIYTYVASDGSKYNFTYDDNYYEIATVADSLNADTTYLWNEFTKAKNKIRNDIINEIKEKAKTNEEEGIILKCTNLNGEKFNITIFDGIEGYLAKIKKYYTFKFDKKRISQQIETYNDILEEKIKDTILEKIEKEKNISKKIN